MDTKNAFGSWTVQGLLVLIVISIAHYFKWTPPDSAVADAIKLVLGLGASIWAMIGTFRSHAKDAQPLTVAGLVVQVASEVISEAPQIVQVAGELKQPQLSPQPDPQQTSGNAGQNG